MTWKVSISVPASDTITDVELSDYDKTHGYYQYFNTTVVVDGVTAIDNGAMVSGSGIVSTVSQANNWGLRFTFDNAYIASKKGKVIEITVNTIPQAIGDGAEFINHANLTYKDANDNKFSADAQATYKYTNSLEKKVKSAQLS